MPMNGVVSSLESYLRVGRDYPRHSSRTCSICGRTQDSRMSTVFVCKRGLCPDRQVHASLDLLHPAISKRLEVAGGLRFDPGAFQHDVMMILYEPAMAARSEPNGTRCIWWGGHEGNHPLMQQNPAECLIPRRPSET